MSLQSACNQLSIADGQKHLYLVADMQDLNPALFEIKNTGFDILINNSAGPAGGALQNADISQLMECVPAACACQPSIGPSGLANDAIQKWGRIVNIISTSVKEPIAMLGVSNTIRGAMASWAKTLASELGKDGITVNNVLPGYTRTQRLDQIVRERRLQVKISQAEVEAAMLEHCSCCTLCRSRRK